MQCMCLFSDTASGCQRVNSFLSGKTALLPSRSPFLPHLPIRGCSARASTVRVPSISGRALTATHVTAAQYRYRETDEGGCAGPDLAPGGGPCGGDGSRGRLLVGC